MPSARHQSEPWTQKRREIFDARRRAVATTVYLADARRIVAAVNAVSGLPTAALESGALEHVLAAMARATEADLEAARRWLRAAGGVPRAVRRGKAAQPLTAKEWPRATRRIAAALEAVAGIRTDALETDKIRELLRVAAAARDSDVEAARRWLTATSGKTGGRLKRDRPSSPR